VGRGRLTSQNAPSLTRAGKRLSFTHHSIDDDDDWWAKPKKKEKIYMP
jgi:hypothetical protein